MPDDLSPIPEITDEDIDWVRNLMGLGVIDAPRRAFLVARTTLDVSACPGSGKTTLLVAKLAILARKWPHHTKGICVLSHTNVAREEIQRRLGGTVIGQRLLDYPHFIDTIHGFVNRFLALPWLSSNGYPSPTIDNGVTAAIRRRALTPSEFFTLKTFLATKNRDLDHLRICARDLSFELAGKPFPAGSHTNSFALAKKAVESAATAGYFCYDEMFIWARALLDDCPAVASWLRRRFPLVLIDEMQDTFELQGELLDSVFSRASNDVVVQRVGDPNQAIYDDADGEPNNHDSFPDPDFSRRLDVPNSPRFGQRVADLASAFAILPVSAGLSGVGPSPITGAPAACGHAIFIFPDNSTAGVLDAYGKHVLSTFGDGALANRLVTAVGAVHQDASDVEPGHGHFPKCVPHYWSGYRADISRSQPHPKTLVQYVRAARRAIGETGDITPGVERMASGIARLAGLVGDAAQLKPRPRTHRAITAALATRDAVALSRYRQFVKGFLIDSKPMTEAGWSAVTVQAVQAETRSVPYAA